MRCYLTWVMHPILWRIDDPHAELRITIRAALNRVYKQWASIFNNDAVLTSALLDRLLHHAETVRIEGKSYRSKDQVEI